jgi:hypothetical protein
MRKAWFAVLLLTASACVSVGPKTVPRDRVEYVEALRNSWKRQLLLNMVGLRYGEAPIFLEVASLINQYSLGVQASAGLGWTGGSSSGNSQSLGVTGGYADRPTITYMPLTGEKYVRSMLTPIPPPSIVGMVQAGWPVDFVFRLAVRSMNGLTSTSGARLMGTSFDPDFYRVLKALRRIQQSGVIGMRVERKGPQDVAVMLLTAKGAEAVADDIRFVREKLGLAQEATEVRITFGTVPADDREIALQTRSMMEVLIELGSWIDVPPQDVTEGRAGPGQSAVKQDDVEVSPLIQVHSAAGEPAGAFTAVSFRDHWFFIDDRDLASKRVFSFLMILLSLAEGGGGQAAPVVTVSAGAG